MFACNTSLFIRQELAGQIGQTYLVVPDGVVTVTVVISAVDDEETFMEADSLSKGCFA